jgi:hypothetical protein
MSGMKKLSSSMPFLCSFLYRIDTSCMYSALSSRLSSAVAISRACKPDRTSSDRQIYGSTRPWKRVHVAARLHRAWWLSIWSMMLRSSSSTRDNRRPVCSVLPGACRDIVKPEWRVLRFLAPANEMLGIQSVRGQMIGRLWCCLMELKWCMHASNSRLGESAVRANARAVNTFSIDLVDDSR